jgi:hypothetical protein
VHGLASAGDVLFRGEMFQAFFSREFDIDADPVGILSCFSDELIGCFWNRLEVNVAFEVMGVSQGFGDQNHLLHGEVSTANDARA